MQGCKVVKLVPWPLAATAEKAATRPFDPIFRKICKSKLDQSASTYGNSRRLIKSENKLK